MKRKCNVCGKEVEIPSKIQEEIKEIVCPWCGARAPLKVRLRNGRVRGLKRCFFNTKRHRR